MVALIRWRKSRDPLQGVHPDSDQPEREESRGQFLKNILPRLLADCVRFSSQDVKKICKHSF